MRSNGSYVGCGSGRAINLMAMTYPSSRFTGYDVSLAQAGDGLEAMWGELKVLVLP